MEMGQRIFTPHMFTSPETGSPQTVLSVLFALSAVGVLRECMALRDRGTHVIILQGPLREIIAARLADPELREAEVTYAFEVTDEYLMSRSKALLADS